VRPSAQLLDSWYSRQDYAAAEVISNGHRRAQARLAEMSIGTLVDVGCGAGSFLDLVPSATPFGLEPSVESARYGRTRGRRIVQPNTNGWSAELPTAVDVVSLFDVVEHLLHPRAFIRSLLAHLQPGGRLVIFTGNAGSTWARRWNRRWWYHGWAGHLSCFSAVGLISLLRDLDMTVESFDELAYVTVPLSLRSLPRIAIGRLASRFHVLRLIDSVRAPVASCPLGLDHMLVVARRHS
jgi:SAM-dependent methyltransferase